MSTEITRAHLDKHLDTRLRNRVRLYLGISLAIIVAIVYRVAVHGGSILYPLLALGIGLVVGIFLARMYVVSWDTNAEKVVSRMDIYGTILLVVYIIFEVSGEYFIRQWFTGPEVLTVILSLAGGAVLGRGLGIGRKMMNVLRLSI